MKKLLFSLLLGIIVVPKSYAQSWEIGARSGFCSTVSNFHLATNTDYSIRNTIDFDAFGRKKLSNKWSVELGLTVFKYNSSGTDSFRYPTPVSEKIALNNTFSNIIGTAYYSLNRKNSQNRFRQYIGFSISYLNINTKTNTVTENLNSGKYSSEAVTSNNREDFNSYFLTGFSYCASYSLSKILSINILASEKVDLHFFDSFPPTDRFENRPTIIATLNLGVSVKI